MGGVLEYACDTVRLEVKEVGDNTRQQMIYSQPPHMLGS
jgi:hypothetical protein